MPHQNNVDNYENEESNIYDATRVPCFRSSLLLGITTGTLITLHRYRTSSPRQWPKALDAGMMMFFVTSVGTWAFCRANYFGKRDYQNRLVTRMQTMTTKERVETQYTPSVRKEKEE